VSSLLDILPAVSELAEKRVNGMDPRTIANVFRDIADLQSAAVGLDLKRDLLPALVSAIAKRLPSLTVKQIDLDLPEIAYALAKLRSNQPVLLQVISMSCQGKLGRVNDWGLCAFTWCYTEIFPGVQCGDFRKRLKEEVSRRPLPEDAIERSQLGPDQWRS